MSSLTIEDQNRTEFRFSPIVGAAIISALGAVLLTELLLARRVSLILNIALPILAGVVLLSVRLRFQNRKFGFLKPFLLTLCFFSPVLVGAKSVLYLFPGSPLFTFKPIVLIIGFIAAAFAAVRFGFMEDREAPIIAAILILTFLFVFTGANFTFNQDFVTFLDILLNNTCKSVLLDYTIEPFSTVGNSLSVFSCVTSFSNSNSEIGYFTAILKRFNLWIFSEIACND
jgi:hypothetical protein